MKLSDEAEHVIMDCSSTPVFDIEALSQAEEAYRARLEREPGDTSARLSLAWCLIIKALHRAGEERVIGQLVTAVETLDESAGRQIQAALEAPTANSPQRNARALLKSCLHETLMVTQLSRSPREKMDAEKLRALVRLSGGREALEESDEEANQILTEITHALMKGWEEDAKVFGPPLQS